MKYKATPINCSMCEFNKKKTEQNDKSPPTFVAPWFSVNASSDAWKLHFLYHSPLPGIIQLLFHISSELMCVCFDLMDTAFYPLEDGHRLKGDWEKHYNEFDLNVFNVSKMLKKIGRKNDGTV